MKQKIRSALMAAASAAILCAAGPALAKDIKVVASIQPIHSLVSGVMGDTGEPTLLVRGAGSPHDYALRPSEARALEQADAVFWVGADLEGFLEKPLKTLARDALSVELYKAPGIALRKGGESGHEDHGEEGHEEDHGHDEHDHDSHEEHADHDEHDHDKHEEHAASEEVGHDGHNHDVDMHVWLDPHYAGRMVALIEKRLSEVNPDLAAVYHANAEKLIAELQQFDKDLRQQLAGVKDKGFLTFHDAYGYFTDHYGLMNLGAVTVSPERKPGAARLREIQETINASKAVCVFSEPQFRPKLVETVIGGTDVRTGVLDPLGADVSTGRDGYLELLGNLADGMVNCLHGPTN